MISISTTRLTYQIGTNIILKDISFALEEGDRAGIVGVNGCGKSTLLKLLTGELEPETGSVFIGKGKTIGILHQDDAFNVLSCGENSPVDETVLGQMFAAFPALCAMEARINELDRRIEMLQADTPPAMTTEYTALQTAFAREGGLSYKSRCKSFLSKLGFDESFHSLPVSALSGGQRTRLALARLLSQEPDILLLDEPTNHLDMDTLAWLESHLANYRKTVIVVSHDRYFLDQVTNKTLDIEHHVAKLYKLPYSAYAEQKKIDRQIAEKHYEIQEREIARIEAYIEQQRRWNRERNIIAAESRQKALDRMVKLEKPKDAPKGISFHFSESGESGNDVLFVRHLSLGYGSRRILQDLSFEVKKKDRFFIVGPNGSGKSTLIKALCGLLPPQDGFIEFGYNVTVGYYDQENQHLTPENTVLDELWDAYPSCTQTEIRSTLALFQFRGEDIEKTVSVLSGGERARLTLAKLILSRMNLLILDEPTNHLDIQSREALEDALQSFEGTVIAVSHDRYFLKKLATKIETIHTAATPCTEFSLFQGSYDSYLEHQKPKDLQAKAAAEPAAPSAQKEDFLRQKQEAARLRYVENRKKAIAKRCAEIESRLEIIKQELYGEAATDYQKAAALTEENDSLETELLSLYEESETL